MKRKRTINIAGISSEVIKVLTNEWQSTAVIACQVDVQPDAIARRRRRTNTPDGCVKTEILAGVLFEIAKKGRAEKRKVGSTKNEYRLVQKMENMEEGAP